MSQYSYVFNKKSNQINVSQNNNIIRKINVNQTDSINSDNLQKRSKKRHLIDKFTSKWLSNDENNTFNFKTTNWHLTIIYLIFFSIPILYSLLKVYAFHSSIKPGFELIFIFYLLPLFGFLISLGIDWNTMIKKGGWAAYSYSIFGFAASFFCSLFLLTTNIISRDENNVTSLATRFLVQQLFQLLGTLLVLLFCKPLRQKIIITLKEAKFDILTWVAVLGVIALVFDTIIRTITQLTAFNGAVNTNNSTNQEGLNKLKNTTYGMIVLIFATCFAAPLNEEISYRFGTFTIVRHRWLGFITSFVFFPSMHIMLNGDWKHITGYLSPSFFLPLLFVMTRGNVTYTIALHAFWNIMTTIVNVIHPK